MDLMDDDLIDFDPDEYEEAITYVVNTLTGFAGVLRQRRHLR